MTASALGRSRLELLPWSGAFLLKFGFISALKLSLVQKSPEIRAQKSVLSYLVELPFSIWKNEAIRWIGLLSASEVNLSAGDTLEGLLLMNTSTSNQDPSSNFKRRLLQTDNFGLLNRLYGLSTISKNYVANDIFEVVETLAMDIQKEQTTASSLSQICEILKLSPSSALLDVLLSIEKEFGSNNFIIEKLAIVYNTLYQNVSPRVEFHILKFQDLVSRLARSNEHSFTQPLLLIILQAKVYLKKSFTLHIPNQEELLQLYTVQLFAMLKSSSSSQACKVLGKIVKMNPTRYIYEVSYRKQELLENGCFKDHLNSLTDVFSTCGMQKVLETSELFIQGLKTIAVLWSERWLHGLISIIPQMYKSMAKLRSEIRILSNNKASINETQSFLKKSYEIAISPFLLELRKLCQLTIDLDPSSIYEQTFKEDFGEALTSMISRISSDEFVTDPMLAFECVKKV